MGNKSSSQQSCGELLQNVHQVKIVVENGKFCGVRGATYKLPVKYEGYHWKSQKTPIKWGDGDNEANLYIDVCFHGDSRRRKFVKAVRDQHGNPFLVEKGHSPTITTEMMQPVSTLVSETLRTMTDDDFENFTPPESVCFDSPVQDLANFKFGSGTSSRRPRKMSKSSSASETRSSGGLDDPFEKQMLDKWQSLERPKPKRPFEICHIVPKSMNSATLRECPDNFLGGSYELHNGFDGLHTNPKSAPRFVLEFVSEEKEVEEAEDGDRSKVRVRLVFRNDEERGEFEPDFRESFKEDTIFCEDGTIEAFVHVRDPALFQYNIGVKRTLTLKEWAKV